MLMTNFQNILVGRLQVCQRYEFKKGPDNLQGGSMLVVSSRSSQGSGFRKLLLDNRIGCIVNSSQTSSSRKLPLDDKMDASVNLNLAY